MMRIMLFHGMGKLYEIHVLAPVPKYAGLRALAPCLGGVCVTPAVSPSPEGA